MVPFGSHKKWGRLPLSYKNSSIISISSIIINSIHYAKYLLAAKQVRGIMGIALNIQKNGISFVIQLSRWNWMTTAVLSYLNNT